MKLKTWLMAAAGALALNLYAAEPQRVLLVVSSYGELDQQGELVKPGFEMSELSKAWQVFKQNGLQFDIASPKGGAVIADTYKADDPEIQPLLADSEASAKLADTLALSKVAAAIYDAIFVVGGKGPMFDLHQDLALRDPHNYHIKSPSPFALSPANARHKSWGM